MEDKNYNNIKELVEVIDRVNKREIEESLELVNDIIKYKCEDEDTISCVFDKMLSIVFASEEGIKEIYYKLLNYTKKFNKELCEDYEELFIEQFKELDEEEFGMYK